jgi:hypothetical protein
VAVSLHHNHSKPNGASMEFDITDLILASKATDLSIPSFSFVRVSGNNSPAGDVIVIGGCKLEVS